MRLIPSSFMDVDKRAIGVVAIVAIIAGIIGSFSVGSLGLFEHRYEMTAVFAESGNLDTTSKVRVAGVDVGQVTGLEADRELGQVIVSFEVNEGVEIGRDARAEVGLSTLLGGEYIRITDDFEAPFFEDLSTEERRIPIENTSVPFSVSEAFNVATETVSAIDTDAVNDLVTGLAEAADGAGPDLERVLKGLDAVSLALTERQDTVSRLVDNTQVLTDTLASKDDALIRLFESATVLLGEIENRRDELGKVLSGGADTVETLADIVSERIDELDAILTDLDIITDTAEARQSEIDTVLSWAGPTYVEVAAIGSNGPFIDVVPVALGPDVGALLEALYPSLGLGGG